MNEPKELAGLLERLRDKLAYTRRLIAEYEETMDYMSHCSLQGFAEGIEFALEEMGEVLKGKSGKKETAKSRGKGKSASKDKKLVTRKRVAQGKPRSKGGKGGRD